MKCIFFSTIFVCFQQIYKKFNSSDESDNRKEEKATTIWSFLLGIFLYFFTIESSEVIYSTYIYDYARCSVNLDLDSSDGTTLNAIFWGTMMGGRAVGIILAKYLTPTVYAAIDLIVWGGFISNYRHIYFNFRISLGLHMFDLKVKKT